MTDDDDPPDDGPADSLLPMDLPAGDAVDAATRKGIKRQVSKARLAQLQTDDFWRRVLADAIGRRTIWGLLTAGHFLEERFQVGPNGFPSHDATLQARGERDFAWRIYHNLLRVDHDAVFLMHKEHDTRFATPKLPRAPKQES